MSKYLLIIIAILGITCVVLYKSNEKNKQLYSISENNYKAANNDKIIYKLTIDQIKHNNDSIVSKLDSLRKELNIKDKKLNSMQYINTIIEKRDTIKTIDTIFQNRNFSLDTTIINKQYSLNLQLQYPNIIVVNPKFENELTAFFQYKKETIKPRKKFFLARWFQRKHIITEVTVVNSNPYVTTKETRFINVLEK